MSGEVGNRRNDIAIAKAIGIILVVAGHAGGPTWLTRFIYEFHMPLFFIASGYFFSPAKADRPWDFVGKRFKGLYLPFVMWSIVFLLLHNVFCEIGLINHLCGAHPMSHQEIAKRISTIVFMMTGYEPHLLGAIWFLRALLISSLVFMGLYCLVTRVRCLRQRPVAAVWTILAIAVAVTAYLRYFHIEMSLPQGGYRECAGLVFYSIGYLFHYYERRPVAWWVAVTAFVVTAVFSVYAPTMLAPRVGIDKFWEILLPGFCGWVMVYGLSQRLVRTRICSALTYVGNHSLIILILHFAAFKTVSALKLLVYDLPAIEIGRHPVISVNNEWMWTLYVVVGVTLPLLARWAALRIKKSLQGMQA